MAFSGQLTATVQPSNANNKNVTFSSDNPAVATVNASGFVESAGAGSTTIRVTTEEGGFVDTCSVTVALEFIPVTNINLAPEPPSMNPHPLNGFVFPTNATNKTIVWSIVDAGGTGATISGNLVTTVNPGTVVVRATIANGTAPGVNYTQDFSVLRTIALTGVSVSPKTLTLDV